MERNIELGFMITNEINIAALHDRDAVYAFINSTKQETKTDELLKNSSKDLKSEKTSEFHMKLRTMVSEFEIPKGKIKLYTEWFKQLVTYLKKNSVSEEIVLLANTIIKCYDRLSLFTKNMRNENLNKYYQNAAKFFYLLHMESKKLSSSKVNYLEISDLFVSRWSSITMTEKERAKYCLASAKNYLVIDNNLSALADIEEGLKYSPNHQKLLELKKSLEFEWSKKRKRRDGFYIQNRTFYKLLKPSNQ